VDLTVRFSRPTQLSAIEILEFGKVVTNNFELDAESAYSNVIAVSASSECKLLSHTNSIDVVELRHEGLEFKDALAKDTCLAFRLGRGSVFFTVRYNETPKLQVNYRCLHEDVYLLKFQTS